MGHYGDREWAAASGGKMKMHERFAQLSHLLRLELTARVRPRPRALQLTSAAEVDRLMKEVELPNTALVSHAAAWVTELGPPALTAHAFRTWAWGVVLGVRDGLTFDRETFAVAALLHDVALAQRTPGVVCFAHDGAEQAVASLARWGAPPATQASVGDAICMHLGVSVSADMPVPHLVNAGAGLDVIGGARFHELPRELRARVLDRYPRLEFKRFLQGVLDREFHAYPASRIGFLVKLGFLDRVRDAPFPE